MALLVQREAEIGAFKPEPFYTAELDFGTFTATSEKFKKKSEADAAIPKSNEPVAVKSVTSKEKTEKAPALYDLTTLQRDANRQLGYTAQQTLDYVQSLYEKKLCTYPRTDSRYLTDDMAEAFLKGTAREKFRETNERVVPWNAARFCDMIEAIKPYNELCDRTYNEWQYIAERTFEGGEYSYVRERAAQHEVFWTREDRLVPMQTELLLKRHDQIDSKLEEAMLRHYGEHAYINGYFWWETPKNLPENFVYNKTRRWFATFNYINQFRGSALYLAGSVEWLMANQNADGLWDWGTQTKDPWGYFGYFSTTRKHHHNRGVDCTMEILDFMKKYIDNNNEQHKIV